MGTVTGVGWGQGTDVGPGLGGRAGDRDGDRVTAGDRDGDRVRAWGSARERGQDRGTWESGVTLHCQFMGPYSPGRGDLLKGGPQLGRGSWPGEGVPAGVLQPRPWPPQTCSSRGPEQGKAPLSPLSPPSSAACVPWSRTCPMALWMSHGTIHAPWSCGCPMALWMSHRAICVPCSHPCPAVIHVPCSHPCFMEPSVSCRVIPVPQSHPCPTEPWVTHGASHVPWSCRCTTKLPVSHGCSTEPFTSWLRPMTQVPRSRPLWGAVLMAAAPRVWAPPLKPHRAPHQCPSSPVQP